MDFAMKFPELDRRYEIHGPLFTDGYNDRIRSPFWVASNASFGNKVNIRFTDTNYISALFNAKDCRMMAMALLHLADQLENIPDDYDPR
jgi:hypothetical protein